MNHPICPFCQRNDSVALLPSGKKAFCESCEKSFEVTLDTSAVAGKTLKLFLSYPHTPEGEYNVCDDIAAFLKTRGHDVWFDRDQLGGHHGADWRRKIAEGIRDSQLVLSCLNSHAVRIENGRRGVCLDELSIAISIKGGNINTVLLEPENTVKPSAALSHRQWLDMSAWREKKEAGDTVYTSWLNQKLEELARMVESSENYTFDGEITEIAKKLGMSDFRLDKRELLEKPFVGREWLVKEVDEWILSPEGGKMCVLYGDPGVGKSAFAVHYAFSSQHVGAILCFEYGNPHYNSVPVMVRAIAFQLACRMSDYRAALLETLKQPGVMDLSDAELFDQLLIKPLRERHIDGKQEYLCVVIDGLDECGEGEKNAAAAVLGQCSEKFPEWLRVLVTSRREAAVLTHLAPDRILELKGTNEKNLEDIRKYYMQELADVFPDKKLRTQAAKALTDRTEGSFLYAYLSAEAIHKGWLDPNDEKTYPRKLGNMLTLWMERLFPDLSEYREFFRLPIGALLASPESLPEEELERLLGMGESEVWDLKRRLNVFLRNGTDDFGKQTLDFEHRYVMEWICSNEAGPFCVSQKDAEKALAKGCRMQFQEGAGDLSGYEVLWIYDLLERAGMNEALKAALASKKIYSRQLELGDWCVQWGKYEKAGKLYQNTRKNAQSRVDTQRSAEARKDLGRSCSRLGTIYSTRGRIAEALLMYQEELAISESLAEELGTFDSQRSLSISYNNVAGIYRTQGRLDDALSLFQKALAISESLAEKLGTPDSQRNLFVSYERIAGVYESQSRLDDALTLYQKALAISKSLAEKLDTPDAQRDLSICYNNVADIYEAQNKLDDALSLHQKALAISKSLAVKLGTPDTQRNVSISYNNIADIYEAQGRLDDALSLYQKALEISISLAEKLGTPDSQRGLFISYERVAGIYQVQGKMDDALSLYQKALEISKSLAEKLNTPVSQRDLFISYNSVAGIYEAQGKLDDALSLYIKALEISRSLAEKIETPDSQRGLSISYNNVAGIDVAQGKPDDALSLYQEALAISKSLAEALGTPDSQRNLFISYINVADIYKAQGKPDDALLLYQEALAISNLLAEKLDTSDSQRDLSISYNHVAGIYRAQGKLDDALSLYQKALAIRKILAEKLETPDSQRDLSISYNNVAGIYEDQGKPDEALSLYQKALEIRKALAEKLETPDSQRDLSISCNYVAGIYKAQGKADDALSLYQKALDISKSLAEELGTPDSQRDLSISYTYVAEIKEDQGKLDNALFLYQKALEISKSLAERLGTPDAYLDLGVSYYRIGLLWEKRNSLADAFRNLTESCRICEKLSEYYPHYIDYFSQIKKERNRIKARMQG